MKSRNEIADSLEDAKKSFARMPKYKQVGVYTSLFFVLVLPLFVWGIIRPLQFRSSRANPITPITPITPVTITTSPTMPVTPPTATVSPSNTPTSTPQYSLVFDGVNDYVKGPNLPLMTDFTIEAWVRRTSDSNGYEAILSDATANYSQAMFTLFVDGGNADCGYGDQFAYFQKADNLLLCSGWSTKIGEWYHVAVVRNAVSPNTNTPGELRFYVNGQPTQFKFNTVAPQNSNGLFAVGRAGSFDGEYFPGNIDEVRISNERIYLFYSPPSRDLSVLPSTVLLWKMNEGTGQIIYDSSTNNRRGTRGSGTGSDARDPQWSSITP